MKTVFTVLLMISLSVGTLAQQKATSFSNAIELHLPKYIESCQNAVMYQEYDMLNVLFDSLVKTHLQGTTVDPHKITRLDGGTINMDSLHRPMLLSTTTSWYLKNDEEIEALNTLASEFKGKIDVVILYWDSKKLVKQASKDFNEDVIVVYVDESSNRDNNIIKSYKHALGVPASFFISSEQKIVDISRGGLVKFSPEPEKELYASNYELFQRHIMRLLLSDELSKDTILSDTD